MMWKQKAWISPTTGKPVIAYDNTSVISSYISQVLFLKA